MAFILRPYRRFPVCWSVTYSTGPLKGHGRIWNLSCTGCHITGDLPMRPGVTLLLNITLPDKKQIGVAEAVVRWSRGKEFAVEYVMKPQNDARLEQHVMRLEAGPPEVLL